MALSFIGDIFFIAPRAFSSLGISRRFSFSKQIDPIASTWRLRAQNFWMGRCAIELSHRPSGRDRLRAKWKAFKARSNDPPARAFSLTRDKFMPSLLYDFLDAGTFRENNGWLARKRASRASFRSREALARLARKSPPDVFTCAKLRRFSLTTFSFADVKNDRARLSHDREVPVSPKSIFP